MGRLENHGRRPQQRSCANCEQPWRCQRRSLQNNFMFHNFVFWSKFQITQDSPSPTSTVALCQRAFCILKSSYPSCTPTTYCHTSGCPRVPSPEDWGCLIGEWCACSVLDRRPSRQLIACQCKKDCTGRYSCEKAALLPCTALCGCERSCSSTQLTDSHHSRLK